MKSYWAEKHTLKVVFDEALGRREEGKKMVRYQINPRENWGPMVKAKGGSQRAQHSSLPSILRLTDV